MLANAISHQKGYSIVHTDAPKKKEYGLVSITITLEDRAVLKRLARARGMKLYGLVHELTVIAFREHDFSTGMGSND
jgi:hypothetical protein